MVKNALFLFVCLVAADANAAGAWANSTVDYVKMATASKEMHIKLKGGVCAANGQFVRVANTDPMYKEKVSMVLMAAAANKTLQVWVDDQTCFAYENDTGFIVYN